jgi:parvulin-like peptidyl-prolyl isomerase
VPRVFKQFAVVLLVVAASSAILSGCSGSKPGNGGKDVAATVNGKEITLSDVDRVVNQQVKASGQPQQLNTIQQAAARLTVLENLIQREALFQRAEAEKSVPSDDEVNTRINQQKSTATAEEWQKFLQESGLTEEQIRVEARKDIAIKNLQDKLFGKITIREQEITDFYNSNREQFVNPRGVGLADIVVDPSDSKGALPGDAVGDAEAAAKIQRIYATLKSNADFAEVARSDSEDQSSVRGGDIGFANEADLRQNGFPPDLIARFFNQMTIGGYTEPIRFGDGRWYIFKLKTRQLETKPRAADDPSVRDDIKNALISQRQQVLQEALIRNAMSGVTVVNKLAESMIGDPNMLGGLQQASPGGATPAASATPSASATATPAPSASASPAATAHPSPAATAARPSATAAAKPSATTAPTRPAGAPSPKQ